MKRTLLALTAALLAGVVLFAIPRGTGGGSDDRAMAVAAEMSAGEKLGRQPFGFPQPYLSGWRVAPRR